MNCGNFRTRLAFKILLLGHKLRAITPVVARFRF
jgi:hypothetical protein